MTNAGTPSEGNNGLMRFARLNMASRTAATVTVCGRKRIRFLLPQGSRTSSYDAIWRRAAHLGSRLPRGACLYSPSCREGPFSETGLPEMPILGNSPQGVAVLSTFDHDSTVPEGTVQKGMVALGVGCTRRLYANIWCIEYE